MKAVLFVLLGMLCACGANTLIGKIEYDTDNECFLYNAEVSSRMHFSGVCYILDGSNQGFGPSWSKSWKQTLTTDENVLVEVFTDAECKVINSTATHNVEVGKCVLDDEEGTYERTFVLKNYCAKLTAGDTVYNRHLIHTEYAKVAGCDPPKMTAESNYADCWAGRNSSGIDVWKINTACNSTHGTVKEYSNEQNCLDSTNDYIEVVHAGGCNGPSNGIYFEKTCSVYWCQAIFENTIKNSTTFLWSAAPAALANGLWILALAVACAMLV